MTDAPLDQQLALTVGLDFWHTHPVDAIGLPSVMLTDGPHGIRKQTGDADMLGLNRSVEATCYPPAVGLSSTWDPDLIREVGTALGREAVSMGIGIVLGPGINIKRSPLCGRNFEYFSEDPYLTGRLGAAMVDGVQSNGIGTSLKHYAANNQETDRMRRDSQIDQRTLREVYLRAFEHVVRAVQPWTLMCSYNEVNGVPMSENRELLTKVLRDEWGFEGFVMSDWGAARRRAEALAAGLDLSMPANPSHMEQLRAGLETGTVTADDVRVAFERVARVLAKAVSTVGDGEDGTPFDAAAHHALARRAAEEAVVLLTNDGVLPISIDEGAAAGVAVIGEFARTPRYQGAGSSRVNPTRLDNALDRVREICEGGGVEVRFAPGFSTEPGVASEAGALDEAVAAAQGASVVLMFLGLGDGDESEGYDRETMSLPDDQLAVLDAVRAVNPNVVVVLSNGSSVLVPFAGADGVRAVVEGWLLGQAGGAALADVLFGLVNPSGKLTETIPLREKDAPSALFFPGDDSGVRYGEGLFVGYKGYDAAEKDVAFPFGHGLSYTTFELSDVAVSAGGASGSGANDVTVTVTVSNTGDRAGREVVQVYMSVPGSQVVRVPRELVGFASVPLEAGESRTVSVAVPAADLAYWSVVDDRWVVEAGQYVFEVGTSSRDLPLQATVELPGDEAAHPLTMDLRQDQAMEVPEFAAAIAARFGEMNGLFEADGSMTELGHMLAQQPLWAMSTFSGVEPDEFQKVIDEVNAEVAAKG